MMTTFLVVVSTDLSHPKAVLGLLLCKDRMSNVLLINPSGAAELPNMGYEGSTYLNAKCGHLKKH